MDVLSDLCAACAAVVCRADKGTSGSQVSAPYLVYMHLHRLHNNPPFLPFSTSNEIGLGVLCSAVQGAVVPNRVAAISLPRSLTFRSKPSNTTLSG